jgi:diguanylate cyclase (GGDEF)-like protein/PAS domain S-box-containing protein
VAYLLLTVAYVVSGKLGLLLALPPGYASPIFPPAGIAVAAVFIGGRKTLPWIFFGSLLLNLWIGYAASQQIDTTGFVAAFAIAAASMLQAAIGGWGLRRALGYPALLDHGREVMLFLLLAPVICLTSASLSVGALTALGIVDTASFATNWAAWWIGDTLGVVVMLPLVMIAAGEPRALWRSRARTVAVPILLIFVLFVAIFLKTNQWEQSETLKEFQQLSQQVVSRIEMQVSSLEQTAGVQDHDKDSSISREEFDHFVEKSLTRLPPVQQAMFHVRFTDQDDRKIIYDNFAKEAGRVSFEKQFSFDGNYYLLETAPTPAYLAQHRGWQSWGVLAMGTFGTGLLGALLLLGTGYAARVEAQVEERTAESRLLEQQLSHRLRYREIMERITQISLGSTSIEELLENVLDEILVIFDADRAWFLYPCDPDAASWSVPMERTRPEWPGAFARDMVIPMTPEVAEVFREVLVSTEPLPYGPETSRHIPAAVAEEFSVRSQIQMALRVRVGSPWTMGLHHCAQAHTYSEDDLLIFGDIGRRVADALSSMIVLKNLRESEERYRLLVESSPFCIHEIDPEGRFQSMNRAGLNMQGLDNVEDICGKPYLEAVSRPDAERVGALLRDAIANGIASHFEFAAAGDVPMYLKSCFIPIKDGEGKVLKIMGIAENITERKKSEERLRQSEANQRAILNNSPYLVWLKDTEGRYLKVNKAYADYARLSDTTQAIGKTDFDFWPKELAEKYRADDAEVMASRQQKCVEELSFDHGKEHWVETFKTPVIDESGNMLGTTGFARDISERKRIEEQIHNLAFYDALTQLPNRRLLLDRLRQVRSASKRSGRYAALMFIDLDNFKPLNDTYGHDTGDLLLVEVARRIEACVREADTVARFGGDEFIVMLSELAADKGESVIQAGAVAEKIRATLAEPYMLNTLHEDGLEPRIIEHRCTSSIGVVLFANHGTSQGDLIRWADMAMYQAKEGGRNRVQFLDPGL